MLREIEMKRILMVAGMVGALAQAAAADIVKVPASGSVAEVTDALAAAVGNAGATIFARVDHGAGAASVDMALEDAELLVFGNPKLGTPAMQDDPLAGLYLPLRVLVYSDAEGQVWLAYEDPAAMLGGLGVPKDAAYLKRMSGALGNLTGAAAGS